MVRHNLLPKIALIQQDDDLMESLQSVHAARKNYNLVINFPPLAHLRSMVQQSQDFYRKLKATPPWTCYFAVELDKNSIRASCGFQGNPSPERTVEMSFFTFPGHEGRGIATATAIAMVQIAKRSSRVDEVIAHTLPQRNASCRVLEKSGFSLSTKVFDAKNGTAWRWSQKVVAPSPSGRGPG